MQTTNIKYNSNFNRDFIWFLKIRHIFNFDGNDNYLNRKGLSIINYDKNGVSGKLAYFKYDSEGKIISTKHPNLLKALLKIKGSINLHIKM